MTHTEGQVKPCPPGLSVTDDFNNLYIQYAATVYGNVLLALKGDQKQAEITTAAVFCDIFHHLYLYDASRQRLFSFVYARMNSVLVKMGHLPIALNHQRVNLSTNPVTM